MDKEFTLEQLLMPGVIDHLIEASVWEATPVSDQPEIALQRWQVMQLPNGDRHFVGWNATEREGRASSKIVAFDAAGNSANETTAITIDTNVFSPSGPYRGIPSYVLAGFAVGGATLFIRRILRRRKPGTEL